MAARRIQENANGVVIDMIEIEQLRRHALRQLLVNAAENHDRAGFEKFRHHGAGQTTGLVLFVVLIIGKRGDWAVVGYHS